MSPFTRYTCALAALVASIGLAGPAAATTWWVAPCGQDGWTGVQSACFGPHGPKRTIHAALSVASDGDEIRVLPGVYPGGLDTLGKEVHIIGLGGAAVTIIDSGGGQRGLLCDSLEGPDTIIEGLTFEGGGGFEGAGAYIYFASPTFRDCIFDNNVSGNDGGGVYVSVASPTFEGCVFHNNYAVNDGGGVYLDTNGYPVFVRCTFDENVANNGNGGALYSDGAHPTLEECDIEDNEAEYGGGLSATNGSLTLIDCNVTGNDAGSGGAIATDSATFVMEDGLVANNTGTGTAGISISHGTAAITDVTFDSNVADFIAGAITFYDLSEDDALVDDCTFANNDGALGGGAIFLETASVTVIDSSFYGNRALQGGAIAGENPVFGSIAELRGCYFNGNEATLQGGAVSLLGIFFMDAVDCDFVENSSAQSAGAIHGWGAALRLTGCRIEGNTAQTAAGLQLTNLGVALITNTTIFDNTAELSSGGIAISGGTSLTMTNCTATHNEAVLDGHSLQVGLNCSAAVRNSIFWNDYGAAFGGDGDLDLRYSIVPAAYSGPGCISVNPQFVDVGLGNLRVQAGSPAIDAGSNWLLPNDVIDADNDGSTGETLDIDHAGSPRVMDSGGCGSGSVDMGAYERAGGVIDVHYADLDGNGVVDATDLLLLIGTWGTNSCPIADLNGDGVVGLDDLLILLGEWD